MLTDYFNSVDWLHLFTSVHPSDVECIWQVLKSILMDAISLFVPGRTSCATNLARKYPP